MILVTTETIQGKEITEMLGVARGSTVRARNIGRDILPDLKILLAVKYPNIQNYLPMHAKKLFTG